MMIERGALLAALALAGCNQPVAAPELNEQEREVAKLRADDQAWHESDPCSAMQTRSGHEVVLLLRPSDCMDFLPAETMRGVWFTGYEESGFIPDVDSVALHREISGQSENPEFDTFLDLDREEALRRIGGRECPGTCAYAITFVGRRAKPNRNRDGSAGMSIIVADALVSGRLLGHVTGRACFRGHPCVYFP